MFKDLEKRIRKIEEGSDSVSLIGGQRVHAADATAIFFQVKKAKINAEIHELPWPKLSDFDPRAQRIILAVGNCPEKDVQPGLFETMHRVFFQLLNGTFEKEGFGRFFEEMSDKLK